MRFIHHFLLILRKRPYFQRWSNAHLRTSNEGINLNQIFFLVDASSKLFVDTVGSFVDDDNCRDEDDNGGLLFDKSIICSHSVYTLHMSPMWPNMHHFAVVLLFGGLTSSFHCVSVAYDRYVLFIAILMHIIFQFVRAFVCHIYVCKSRRHSHHNITFFVVVFSGILYGWFSFFL